MAPPIPLPQLPTNVSQTPFSQPSSSQGDDSRDILSLFSNNGSSQLDFSQFCKAPDQGLIDPNTAEGRAEQQRLDAESRRSDAAMVCIRNFNTVDKHMEHWPVTINYIFYLMTQSRLNCHSLDTKVVKYQK